MNKCHTPITWVNDQAPAINDTHLNQYDGELDTLDDRIITLDSTKALQSDLLLAFKDVALNSSTGVITFTLFNNTTKTIDTLLEKIAINFDYDDDPTSPHYQNLIIELEDGTYKYIDMSALITEYEFTDSSTIDFTVTSGAVSASVIDGSITATKCDPTFALAITNAESNGLKSEGYANGTQNGTPVTSGSPYYENNAKYWKEQAQAIASQSLSGLTDVSISSPQDGDVLAYDAGNSEWKNSSDLKDSITYLYNNTGGKNLNSYPYYEGSRAYDGITYTVNDDGTITVSGSSGSSAYNFLYLHSRTTANPNPCKLNNGTYILTGCPAGGSESTYKVTISCSDANNQNEILGVDYGNGVQFTVSGGYYSADYVYVQIQIHFLPNTVLSTPITFKPMIRDASISDDTYVPYAKTNSELTQDKVEKTDLTSIIATGSTNTTGAQIPNGAYFYLNGVFCRAIADIASNASFTKNTNYKETTVGGEIADINTIQSVSSATFFSSSSGLTSSTIYKFGKLFVISVRLSANSSGWATAAQVDTSKYSIRNKCTSIGANGTVMAQVDLTTAGVLERYSTDNTRTFDTTLVALIDEI